jgi:uncharacterized protein YbjT (DUF2867 family)
MDSEIERSRAAQRFHSNLKPHFKPTQGPGTHRISGDRMSLILTYGSTGSQGEPVARKLLEAGHQVRAVMRHPERAAGLQAKGAKIVQGDLADLESLKRASLGADAVFLMLPFSAQGNPFELLSNALEAAKSADVKFLVFNASGKAPDKPTGIPMLDFRIQLEDFIADCGIPNVILQPGAYMENFLGPWCLPAVQNQNMVVYPHRKEMRVSWIASEDLGSLAVAALERPELAGQRFTLGGPKALDGAAIARAFSAGLGRKINYQAITPEAFAATMAQIMGPEAGEGIRVAYGYSNAQPDDAMSVDMSSVLERLPVKLTTLEDWVRSHAHAFAPSTSLVG